MIRGRLGNDPPEIEEETNRLIAQWYKWSENVNDDDYLSPDEYSDLHASKKWLDYMNNERQRIAEAKANGIRMG